MNRALWQDKIAPSIDQWLIEAKKDKNADKVGMYLSHNGVVRETSRAKVREKLDDGRPVKGMFFSYIREKVQKAIEDTYKMEGIFFIRVWLNEGNLKVGDDIMYLLIGGDIRPHVIDALLFLVGEIKTNCVTEIEEK